MPTGLSFSEICPSLPWLHCVALVEYATNGKKHAEKVALRRYLHNIKLKIMLNVYELLFDILI